MHGAVTLYGNENYRGAKHWAEQIIGHSLQDSEMPGSPCCAPPPPQMANNSHTSGNFHEGQSILHSYVHYRSARPERKAGGLDKMVFTDCMYVSSSSSNSSSLLLACPGCSRPFML